MKDILKFSAIKYVIVLETQTLKFFGPCLLADFAADPLLPYVVYGPVPTRSSTTRSEPTENSVAWLTVSPFHPQNSFNTLTTLAGDADEVPQTLNRDF